MIGYAEQQPNNRVKTVKVFDEHNRELFTVYGLLISYDEKSVSIEKDCEIEKYDEKGNLISENKSNICNIENDSKLDVKENSKKDNLSKLVVDTEIKTKYDEHNIEQDKNNSSFRAFGEFLFKVYYVSSYMGYFTLPVSLFAIYVKGISLIGMDSWVLVWIGLFPIISFIFYFGLLIYIPSITFILNIFVFPIGYMVNALGNCSWEWNGLSLFITILLISWIFVIPVIPKCFKETLKKEREEAQERKRIREEKKREEQESQRYIAEHTSKDTVPQEDNKKFSEDNFNEIDRSSFKLVEVEVCVKCGKFKEKGSNGFCPESKGGNHRWKKEKKWVRVI